MPRFFVVFALVAVLAHVSNSQDYAWPTDASRLFTSSFAESRGGRFHAGVDFKTWGVTGYPIYAVRDGYVSRIRVSPYGYGRALYLTLDTGEIVVYGHLEKFNDEIEAYVKAAQKNRNSFDIQLYPKSSQFPVKKGELIARSGDTGVGYPHLHFEVRDAASNPINPLLKGYTVVDRIAPYITKVLIQPLDALSTVNGDFMPKVFRPSPVGQNSYQVSGTIIVAGRIGFGVDAFDQMDGVDNRFGTYRNEFYINDQLIFSAQYDKFPYALNNHFSLDRDFRQRMYGNGYIYNLFRDFGNKLPFYSSRDLYAGVVDFYNSATLDSNRLMAGEIVEIPSGVLKMDGGNHTFKIVVQDFWGNVSSVSGRLAVDGAELVVEEDVPVDTIYGPLPPVSALVVHDLETSPKKDINFDVTFYDRFLRLKLSPRIALAEAPTVSGWLCSGKTYKAPLTKSTTASYVGAWPLSGCDQGPLPLSIQYITQAGDTLLQNEWIEFSTVPRGQAKTVYSEDGNCKIDFSANSLFKDIFVRTQKLDNDSREFDMEGAQYRLYPFDVPLDKGATLTLTYADNAQLPHKLAVYMKLGNRMSFVGNEHDPESRRISTHISSFGTYTLVRDTEPPRIIAMSPVDGTRTNNPTPLLRAVFKDELSGIAGEANRVMKLDGRKVIAEYDPEKLVLFYTPDEPLIKGEHVFELFLRDQSGNVTTRTHTFYID